MKDYHRNKGANWVFFVFFFFEKKKEKSMCVIYKVFLVCLSRMVRIHFLLRACVSAVVLIIVSCYIREYSLVLNLFFVMIFFLGCCYS
jgi:hypothetical protein